jgi:hypothetical protein
MNKGRAECESQQQNDRDRGQSPVSDGGALTRFGAGLGAVPTFDSGNFGRRARTLLGGGFGAVPAGVQKAMFEGPVLSQAVTRSEVPGEADRRGWPLPEPARQSHCPLCRQKEPDSGSERHSASHLIAANDGPEQVAVHDARGGGPGVEGHLNPGRHRNGPHSAVLPVEVYDAPSSVALLDMHHGERRHFGPA